MVTLNMLPSGNLFSQTTSFAAALSAEYNRLKLESSATDMHSIRCEKIYNLEEKIQLITDMNNIK